jgi:hypothetical protein
LELPPLNGSRSSLEDEDQPTSTVFSCLTAAHRIIGDLCCWSSSYATLATKQGATP